MPTPVILLLITLSIALITVFVFQPQITTSRAGKIMAFLVLFAFPLLCMEVGVFRELEQSKSTEFCLSCHIMEPYGKSLRIDDPQHLAAAHFQNHRVPVGESCYTCHTNYAMFGGLKAKIGGLRHLYVYYFGTPPAPEKIKLYQPFNNRECLHCHAGARSFEENAVHTARPGRLSAIKANETSCLSSGCHQVVHNVGSLNNFTLWKAGL